jgi:hypothetical protein
VLEFLIPYLAIIAYLIIPTSDHSFTLVLLSDILSILQKASIKRGKLLSLRYLVIHTLYINGEVEVITKVAATIKRDINWLDGSSFNSENEEGKNDLWGGVRLRRRSQPALGLVEEGQEISERCI